MDKELIDMLRESNQNQNKKINLFFNLAHFGIIFLFVSAILTFLIKIA